jgi:hypothetical protein
MCDLTGRSSVRHDPFLYDHDGLYVLLNANKYHRATPSSLWANLNLPPATGKGTRGTGQSPSLDYFVAQSIHYGIMKVYKTKEVVKKHLLKAFRDVGFSGELQVGSATTGTKTKTIIVPEEILEIEQHLKKCWDEKERKRRAIKVPGVPELNHLQGMDRTRAILAFETHGGPHKMNANDNSHVDLVERLGKLPKDTLREILVEYLTTRPEIAMSLASLYATQVSGVKSSASKVRIVTLLDLGTRHLIIYPVYRYQLLRRDSAFSPSSARTSPNTGATISTTSQHQLQSPSRSPSLRPPPAPTRGERSTLAHSPVYSALVAHLLTDLRRK